MNDDSDSSHELMAARYMEVCAALVAADHPVSMLVVSKGQEGDKIRQLAVMGQHSFAESYCQEALTKIALLSDLALEWHFIGRIQKNKVAAIAEHFDWVQSVDSQETLLLLAKSRAKLNLVPLNICIQVNISREPQKGGAMPEELPALVEKVSEYPSLVLRGIMAIPARNPSSLTSLMRMRELYEDIKSSNPSIDTLSMGMSGDYLQAIDAGSTMVRIGEAIMGRRDK